MLFVGSEEESWARGDAGTIQTNVPEVDDNMKPLNEQPSIQNGHHASNEDV